MAFGLIKDFSKGAVAARNRVNALKAKAARSGLGRISKYSSNATPQSLALEQRKNALNAKAYAAAYNGTLGGGSGGGSLSYAGGGGAGAGVGGSNAANNMKASWQKAYDEAKAANKARENELRQKYKDRYSAVMGGLKGMGEQNRKDILEQGKRREGEASQNAISRGLSMGTIANSLQNSVREGTDRNIGQLNESIRNTKLGYESSLRKDEADFIERITDQYPDQRMYANMFQQYGQGQAGAGGVGAGGIGGYGGYGAIGSTGGITAGSAKQIANSNRYNKPTSFPLVDMYQGGGVYGGGGVWNPIKPKLDTGRLGSVGSVMNSIMSGPPQKSTNARLKSDARLARRFQQKTNRYDDQQGAADRYWQSHRGSISLF